MHRYRLMNGLHQLVGDFPVQNAMSPRAEDLSVGVRVLALAMRRWPRQFRRTAYWWARLYDAIGGGGFSADPRIDRRWPEALQAPVRGARHPYRLRLNTSDWSERRAYFSGSIYQDDLERLIAAIARPGDHFVDVGANIGLISLLAAHLVGREGRVYSFEANPSVFARLKEHVTLNALAERVVLHNVALGAETRQGFLSVDANHAGSGTLTKTEGGAAVEIRRGDVLLPKFDARAPVIVKIDVEGYDLQALRGLISTIADADAAIIIEVTEKLLARIGDTSSGIYDLLRQHGFRGFSFSARLGRFGTTLRVEPARSAREEEQYDALFLRTGSAIEQRLRDQLILQDES